MIEMVHNGTNSKQTNVSVDHPLQPYCPQNPVVDRDEQIDSKFAENFNHTPYSINDMICYDLQLINYI